MDLEMMRQQVIYHSTLMIQEAVGRELARRRFLVFCEIMFPSFIWVRHHEILAWYLEQVRAGEIDRLGVSMPPRHTKSEMCSVGFPAWMLGLNPALQIMHISYAASLSNEFSRRVRMMVRDDLTYRSIFPSVQLDPERQRIDDWKTTAGGGFKSVGVEGGISGHGADLLIIDDPHKEGDEKSPATLQATWDWYNTGARTRLSPNAAILVVQTRWHPRDLLGRLYGQSDEDSEADQWTRISFPALAEENDPLGREIGEPLFPERFSRQSLLAIRAISEDYFRSLYQQRPEMSETPLFRKADFKRFAAERYRPSAFDGVPVWGIDLAATENERSDYTVFTRGVLRGERLRIYEVRRFRAEWPEARRALVGLFDAFPDDYFAFPKHFLELLAVQELIDVRPEAFGRIVQVKLPNDLLSAALPLSVFARGGLLDVCDGEAGDSWVKEHCDFPDSAPHDDCVASSSALAYALGLNSVVEFIQTGAIDEQHEDLVSEVLAAVGRM